MENQQQSTNYYYLPGQIIANVTLIECIEGENKWKVKCNRCGTEYILSTSSISNYKRNGNLYCKHCTNKPKISKKYKLGDIIGNCYELIEFIGGNNWSVKCIKCGKVQTQAMCNMKRHKSEECNYCKHPNATKNKAGGRGVLRHAIDETYYNYYKQRVESNNNKNSRKYKEWDLTLEDFTKLVHSDCLYCGKKPSKDNMWNKSGKRKTILEEPEFNGIDRVDSNKGYIIENCVPCCTICNHMKNDLTTKEFFNHISILYKRNICKCSTTSQIDVGPSGSEMGGILTSNVEDKDIV